MDGLEWEEAANSKIEIYVYQQVFIADNILCGMLLLLFIRKNKDLIILLDVIAHYRKFYTHINQRFAFRKIYTTSYESKTLKNVK